MPEGARREEGSLIVSMLIRPMPATVALVDFDPLQYFSWWVYGFTVVTYTALAFHGELPRKGALIFSRRNARSSQEIITIHLAFLLALLLLMRAAIYIYPILPDWMTDTFNGRGSAHSAFDILFIVVMIALHYVERRWLYVDSETDNSHPEYDSS
jgi:hypothetical protein